uniref:Anionic trypsin-2 n=1 Tax=Caligus rogercresseyi TaxID=217165 RepID=C1BQ60_CALRO|nr:Anionic trypsin-2 precursor [Caligus rogercresseyi]
MFKGIFAILSILAAVSGRRFSGTLDFNNPELYKDSRIIGGEVVEPNSIPYQISIKNSGFHFCGGSIYDENTVITAAHCCPSINSRTQIVAGEHHQLVPSSTEQKVNVKEVIAHSGFSFETLNNDICILKLAKPFQFNDKVSAVKMPEQGQEMTGKAVVSGWGSRIEGFPGSFKLFKAELTMMAREKCDYLLQGHFDDTMVCANGVDQVMGSCHGDSGGPLVCEGGVQCGIVSWGFKCGRPETPGVYANLSHFIDWIKEKLA